MPASLKRLCVSALVPLAIVACAKATNASAPAAASPTAAKAPSLAAFHDEKEWQAYLDKMRKAGEKQRDARASEMMSADAAAVALPAPASPASEPAAAGDSITNVQTAGVDEGGIVKKAGDFLVVLRRGRLFSIRADAKNLQAVSSINAYGPDVNGAGAWYDEMLISGDTIIVIGFSYERGGTEVGLFHLSKDGKLAYRSTYQLNSNDYYSSRNYASRLIGNTLVFYSPIDLFDWSYKAAKLPGVRHWNAATPKAPFQRIVPAERIYRSGLAEDSLYQTLHTVTRCDLQGNGMDCHSSSVLGPSGGTFYVSRDAVYVWMVDNPYWYGDAKVDAPAEASVLRMPLDDAAPPTALRVHGSPIDQMSFLEANGSLNVLVGADAKGARMWAPESNTGGLALLRARLDEFGDASATARADNYQALPSGSTTGYYWGVQNRYVGPWLIYGGADQGSGPADGNAAYAVRIDRRDDPTVLRLGHSVQRIEAMGNDALVVGAANVDLHLSSLALGNEARLASKFVMPSAAQGDSRTHGFFYKPLAKGVGVFGLPVVSIGGDRASVQFLRNERLQLRTAGGLAASAFGGQDGNRDDCVASCVDWYGDARPIFIGERIYALLGYELVEGRLQGGQVRETRRLGFAPQSLKIAR
jgi:hypothetical protein